MCLHVSTAAKLEVSTVDCKRPPNADFNHDGLLMSKGAKTERVSYKSLKNMD